MEGKKDEEEKDTMNNEDREKRKSMAERLTGFQIFSEKSGAFSLEKLEAAAEEMENDVSAIDDVGDVDEDLFDDDEDLDDLDFDSDEDDESDEEPDI
jgi:hypothetical protein